MIVDVSCLTFEICHFDKGNCKSKVLRNYFEREAAGMKFKSWLNQTETK